jgi:hypothetical protein
MGYGFRAVREPSLFARTSPTRGDSSSGAHAEPEEAGTDQEKGPWLRHGGDAGQLTDLEVVIRIAREPRRVTAWCAVM